MISSHVSGIMFWCLPLLILFSKVFQSDHLQLVGPEAPLLAVAGEDLILPCLIKHHTSAVDMAVEWFKLHVKDSSVHLYRDHEDRNEDQAQSYRGRTSLFKEELQKGNASLKLSGIRVSDEGSYKCLIEDKSASDDITVKITVEAQGSRPLIRMESFDNSGGINLVCESRGWNPEPEVLWLDREGSTLPAEDTQRHRDTEGFSVKRRITVYDSSDSKRFFCRLLQKHHMIETEVIIDSNIFDAWRWIVCISVSACLVAVGLIITLFILHKKDMQKEKQVTDFVKKKLYAVDVTLDPDSAHPNLILSADGKEVTHGDTEQDLPDTPQRFNESVYVLGMSSFHSGRFYYEVQVRQKTAWVIGVMRENINRKREIPIRPLEGLWAMAVWDGHQYWAYEDPPVPLKLRKKLELVGVFVDYEEGLVSFYDVMSSSHIYSFTDQSFKDKLYPFFSPWSNDGVSLIISSINKD